LKGELQGDTVQVQLRDAASSNRVRPALAGLPGLRDIALDSVTLRARAENGATAVPAILAALESAGAPVASVTVARPSLDDVYLRYAGHAFDSAGLALTGGA
jgi:ABC-2 type transport system ATP-binding protein